MIKITTEDIVSSLLALRFQKVDKILYLLTLSKLTLEREGECLFELVNSEYSDYFNTYIDNDIFNFKLKEEYSLFSNDMDGNTIYSKLRNKNRRLTDYLETFDFEDIIIQKIKMISTTSIGCDYKELFCDKEREIIIDIFGIKQMYREYAEKSRQVYSHMYDQENSDISNAINTLKRIKK